MSIAPDPDLPTRATRQNTAPKARAEITVDELKSLGRRRIWSIISKRRRMAAFMRALDLGLVDSAPRGLRAEAMRIYWRALEICGIEKTTLVSQQIYVQLGARDEGDARRMVDIVREAEAKPLEQRVEDGAAWLAQQLLARPDLRASAAAHLMPILHAAPQLEAHNGKEDGAA